MKLLGQTPLTGSQRVAKTKAKQIAAAKMAGFKGIGELCEAILSGEVVVINEAYFDALLNQE